MTIDVVVLLFEAVWVIGWYLEWAISDLPIDPSVCVILEHLRALEHWVPGSYHMNEL